MNYKETIDYLFNIAPAFENIGKKAYKANLNNTLALDEHFGHPHTRYKCIHVAGTNGKGSCSHTLASILMCAGYKVGLYTSPHILDFRERIKINGKCIEEDYVVDFVKQERNFFEKLSPSFFEVTTALAFKYFAEKQVDFAVIEVGLGGRLDCTNIITPVLSVITNISFDHTEFLGNTLSAIAAEKAGIIKPNVPIVIGEAIDETRTVFETVAHQKHAPITFAEDCQKILSSKTMPTQGNVYMTSEYGEIVADLEGSYQNKNANTVLTAVDVLRTELIIDNDDCVKQGFANVKKLTGIIGRWQYLNTKPVVVCDTGHNLGGWQYLSELISMQKCKTKRIVFGMVNDKDIDGVMSLLPKDAVYYFTRPSTKRALPEDVVKEKGSQHGLSGDCYHSVYAAYRQALDDADDADFVFVGGSSYVVSDLLVVLNECSHPQVLQ